MTANTRRRTALAAGTALALGVLGTLTAAGAAHAVPIDQSKQGSIVIHKYANPGNGDQNPSGTGTKPSTQPVVGVVFEYCRIDGIDLFDGKNSGWDNLNAITTAQKLAAAGKGVTTLGSYSLSGCKSMAATDAKGDASSGALPLGPYFVREVSAPSSVVEQAAPFIVTLPTPANHKVSDGNWVYDVNVYPKNTVAEGPKKNVITEGSDGALLGSPVTYEVTQLIPALANGDTYKKFIVSDVLDARLTPITTAPVTVKMGQTVFGEGTDYTTVWSGQKLTITFTPTGLAKLQPAQNVVFSFQAKANAPGEITNTAFVNLNDFELTPGSPNGPDGSPTGQKASRWGDLTVRKINENDQSDGLKGATFQLYLGTTDSNCQADTTGLSQVLDPATGDPYEVTSDDSGIVFIPGLWVGDTETTVAADGTVSNTTKPGHDVQARCYVLKEVVAPAGFVLPSGSQALTAVLVKTGANGSTPLTSIKNVQQGAPELPFTGSNVQIALTIGGIALIVIAFGGVMLIRRRRRATPDENA